MNTASRFCYGGPQPTVLERDKRNEYAIKDVEEGSSIRKAAGKWSVPRSTVQDKCSGWTKRLTCAPLPFITRAKEERLTT